MIRDRDPMTREQEIAAQLRVEPGSPARLGERDPAWTLGPDYEALSAHELKERAREVLKQGVKDLARHQELLWASDSYSLLVVFQALDAAGKDSAIEHVMSGVNPQGVQVVSFKQPSAEELDHDFLWRTAQGAPRAGSDRDLQSVALRGSRRPSRASRMARRAATPARRPWDSVLGGALRRHQRLRAASAPQRDEDPEVLPSPVEGASRSGGSLLASTTPTSTGSSTPRMSRSGSTGTST